MEEIYLRIEDYLDGALPPAERSAFEADLETDAALAEALAQVRDTRERMQRQWAQAPAEAELTKTLHHFGERHFGRPAIGPAPAKRIRLLRWWPAAAAAIAALLIWLAVPPGPERLYGQYRQFPEAAFTTKSNTSTAQNLQNGESAFNKKEYSVALAALNKHLEINPEDPDVRLFAGLCQLELGQTGAAKDIFQALRTTSYAGEALWYLGLSHLKEKDKAKCAEILGQIGPGQEHYGEAQELLKRL